MRRDTSRGKCAHSIGYSLIPCIAQTLCALCGGWDLNTAASINVDLLISAACGHWFEWELRWERKRRTRDSNSSCRSYRSSIDKSKTSPNNSQRWRIGLTNSRPTRNPHVDKSGHLPRQSRLTKPRYRSPFWFRLQKRRGQQPFGDYPNRARDCLWARRADAPVSRCRSVNRSRARACCLATGPADSRHCARVRGVGLVLVRPLGMGFGSTNE